MFARAMTRFMVQRDFLKLASSIAASSLLGLWSMICAIGVVTQVGAKVSLEAVETVRVRDRRNACELVAWVRECCRSRRG